MAAPHRWLAPAVVTGAMAPVAAIALRAARGRLGAEPVAEVLNQLGLVALALLVATLACTPLKLLSGWTWPVRLRRTLGLLAFFYASLHVLTYAVVDQGLGLAAILADVSKRKFIFVGFAAFVLLLPLGLTSTDRMVRRLGFVRWKWLHRLAYAAGILAVIHFVWRVKKDRGEPYTWAAIVAALLAVRLGAWAARTARGRLRPSGSA